MTMRMNMMMMMMEAENEEEEEEEEEIEHVFIAHEIDIDYEFDAARFFDFTRPETLAEAQRAEFWFQTAPNYPPSPFVTKLVARKGFRLDNGSDSPNLECASNLDDEKSSGMEILQTVFDGNGSKAIGGVLQNDAMNSTLQQVSTGLTFSSKTTSDALNSKDKCTVAKSSTLTKPTASLLAKQNRHPQNVGSRFQKLLTKNERNLSTSSGVESQAAKRQKLEGGLLCKVIDVKQQTDFVHKAPKRTVTIEQNMAYSKLKLTIPREPDLKTAQRAQRIRPKNVAEAEQVTVGAPKFKARPLNRKILDAPSLPLHKRSTPQLPEFQEFHLKTSVRAMQHASATSSSSFHCNGYDKELNVYSEKVVQCNPPVELFSKLSLTAEIQPNNGSRSKLPQQSRMCRKEKPFMFGAKQIHSGNGGCISGAGTLLGATRFGIR